MLLNCLRECAGDYYILMMKCLILAMSLLLVAGQQYANITCWDICSKTCKSRYGWITDQCVRSCGCPCDLACDNLCVKYMLGWPCRFKCGCFQTFTFGFLSTSLYINPNRRSKRRHRTQRAHSCRLRTTPPPSPRPHSRRSSSSRSRPDSDPAPGLFRKKGSSTA